MPIWIGVLIIIALIALVLYMAFVAARHDRAKEAIATSKQKMIDTRTQERDTAVQAFTELDILHQKATKERDEWMRLYGELRDTLNDLRGDAHATAPLQEAAPMSYDEAKPAVEQAASTAPAKRPTRKPKAGQP